MSRLVLFLACTGCLLAQTAGLSFLNHNRTLPDAHNCYPYEGRWADRIERALKSGFPIAIEQDLAWRAGNVVVGHEAKTIGVEPTLRAHFFERVRPLIEAELKRGDRSRWPLIVLHFDVKDNQPALLGALRDLLAEYKDWMSSAAQTSGPHQLAPIDARPLLVLTEDNDLQEEFFFRQLKPGQRLYIFGSAHTNPFEKETAASVPPERLLSERPTNYRRWWNSGWAVVEQGGQPVAGEWTGSDAARLKALVDHAHALGYWIRFYTLDGFAPADNQGWHEGYNFGTRAAVEARWKAAVEAGVDVVAGDQYEEMSAFVRKCNGKR